MDHYNHHSRRARRRANPSGAAAASATAHTAGKIIAGAFATFLGKKALGMKKADGTPRWTERQQLVAQGAIAAAAAFGGAMTDNKVIADVLDGTAVVMGGDAVIQAARSYNIEGQVRGLIPGAQPAAQNPALPAPSATAPGGWVGVSNPYASLYS